MLSDLGEEILGRPAGRGTQFFKGTTFDLGDCFGNLLYVGGFAALAAIRDGCEIRAIGFEHKLAQRRGRHRVTNALAVLERNNAGEAHEGAERQHALHRSGIVGETMKYDAHAVGERL